MARLPAPCSKSKQKSSRPPHDFSKLTTLILSALLVMVLGSPARAEAVDFEVGARTVGQAFDYLRVDNGLESRYRVTQYLTLNAHDLLGDGEHQLKVRSLMRFDTDLGLLDENFNDGPFGLERRFNRFHILFLYLEGQGLWDYFSFRAGRQMTSDVLGWYDFDGLWTSTRLWRGLEMQVYGGMETKQDILPINDAAFDPDGTNPDSSSFNLFDRPVYAIGAGVSYKDLTYGQAQVNYRRSFWHISRGVERERLGGHATGRPIENLKLYGGTVYNLFLGLIDQAEGGAEWTFVEQDMTVGVEYFRLVPHFDADSIFNVFNVYAYDEARLRYGWQVNEDLYSFIRLGARFYGQDDDLTSAEEENKTFTLRWTTRWKTWRGLLTSLTHQSEFGYAGRRHYTAVGMQSPFYHDFWRISGRLLHINFDAVYTQKLEGNAFGANLGTAFRLGNFGQFQLLAEHAVNPFLVSDFRVLAMLDLNFHFAP